MFRYCETKQFRRKIVILPPSSSPSYPYFSPPENFWNTAQVRVPLRSFSVLRDKKSWYSLPLPLLSIKFFDTINFVKHRRVPLRRFSVLWDNKFSIENRDSPLVGIKYFDTRNFLKHRRVPLLNDSVLWDKNFNWNSWYSFA